MKISPIREMHVEAEENLPLDAAKTMFEIYREAQPPFTARVVYYTELQEFQHQREIERAFSADSIFSGFLWDRTKTEAKKEIAALLDCLNDEEDISDEEIGARLHPYLA
ncbi:MAG: hypothetical protein JSV08_02250 [Acidobacteriota bacterium]|nr:MAG: hypothetical protein JSV08_02250 [Acidobacteriota bacterium]